MPKIPRRLESYELTESYKVSSPEIGDLHYTDGDASSLVAWYKFSESKGSSISPGTTVADASLDSSYDGTYYGNIKRRITDDGPGTVHTSVEFLQTYSSSEIPYIDIGYSTVWDNIIGTTGTSRFSFAAWVKIVSAGEGDRGTIVQFGGQDPTYGSHGIRLFTYTGMLNDAEGYRTNSIGYRVDYADNDYVATTSSNIFEPNVWFHIAAVHDASSCDNSAKIYINGSECQLSEKHPSNSNPALGAFLGVSGGYQSSCIIGNAAPDDTSLSRLLDGEIHEFVVWNDVLTEESVRAVYHNKVYPSLGMTSGFLNKPVRVIQHEYDCEPLSYPSISRSGPGGISGNEPAVPFDDSKTIIFDSAYATAWLYFYARPRDASTITLFDSAGSIDLLPATAGKSTVTDDLVVESNSELIREQVYEIEIVESSTWPTPTFSGTFEDTDNPEVSGQWTGISWSDPTYTGIDSFSTEYDYRLTISIGTIGIPHSTAIGSDEPASAIGGADPSLGTFSVLLEVDPGTGYVADPDVSSLEFEMPITSDAEFITGCNLVAGTMTESVEKKLEGIKITWPNPWNSDSGTEDGTTGELVYDQNTTVNTGQWVLTGLPKPDKFKWRKANLEDYRYRNNWTDWSPDMYIGTGNAKKSYTITNAKYGNIEDDGFIYTEVIDLNEIDTTSSALPLKFDIDVYARGDVSRVGADPNASDEYYAIYYSLNPSDSSPTWVRFDGLDPSSSAETVSNTIFELMPSQRYRASESDSGTYEYDATYGRWNGVMSYAPFADGHKFTEKELKHVAEEVPGNKYEYMANEPHLSTTDINVTTESIQFKIKPGSAVSWGKCQVKFVINYTGLFWYFDDIDNEDASGNNIRLKWGSFSGHSTGDRWTVNVEDTTSETFEFNRGKITNPANTEVRSGRRIRSRNQINGLFAKAVNNSGLQIEAHHDGDRVLLRQTIPGKVGNLEIHADNQAKVHISNSAKYTPGGKGEVTGSFSGGDGHLVSYPTTLPARSQKSVENVIFWANRPDDDFSSDGYNVIATTDINLSLDINNNKLYRNSSNEITTSFLAGWDPENYLPDYDNDGIPDPTNGSTYNDGEYWFDESTSEVKRFDISLGWRTEDEFMADPGTGWLPIVGTLPEWNEQTWREYSEHNFVFPAYIESPWLNSNVMTPNVYSDDYERTLIESGLVTIGATRKGIADAGLRFTEDQTVFKKGPFIDDQIDIDIDNEFFEQGISPDVFEGFSSPLRSKMQFTIELPTDTPTSFGYDATNEGVPYGSQKYNSMVYYNFETKEWEKIGPGRHIKELRQPLSWDQALAAGYVTKDQWDKFVNENSLYDAGLAGSWGTLKDAEFQQTYFENACIGFSRGTEIIQSASMTAALPISNFGFPMHPKFHASPGQLLDMSNYIDKPFILEKFVLEFEADWSEGSDYSGRSIMFDVGPDGKIRRYNEDEKFNNKAAINSFFILNQRDWIGNYEYNSNSEPSRRWYPPRYDRNVVQNSSVPSKNMYMWDGSSYDYDESSALTAWFRFDTKETDGTGNYWFNSCVKADLNMDGVDDASSSGYGDTDDLAELKIINASSIELAEDSPWEFPPGAPTVWDTFPVASPHGDYTKSAKMSQSTTYMFSSLGDLAGKDPFESIPSTIAQDASGTGSDWFWNSDSGPTDGTPVQLETFTSNNQPGTWGYGFAFANDPTAPGTWQSEDITKNVRVYFGDKLYGVTTVRYKLIQAVANQYVNLNEPPDVGMEGKSYNNNTYAHEGLIFQVASAVDEYGYSISSPEYVDPDDWVNIIEHDPDYSMQGIWQDHASTIDPSTYNFNADSSGNTPWFVRWVQPGTSGWPDAWMITDMSAGSFSSFSKSLWFKTTNPGAKYSNLLTIASNKGAPNKIWLSIYKDGTLRFLVDNGLGRVYTRAKSADAVTDGLWHHTVFSFSSETQSFKLWLDGEFIGEYNLPQLTNDDGELLWRKGDSTEAAEAVTIGEANISVEDILQAGISSLSLNESYYGKWNTATESFDWDTINGTCSASDPAHENDSATCTGAGHTWTSRQARAASLQYSFVGLESKVIGGVSVTLTPEELMSAIGYNPAYPWYFESSDYVILGADVDWEDADDDNDVDLGELSYDNLYTGSFSDFAVWSTALDGIDAKAIYHMDSGVYKAGKNVDVSLNGNNPYFFDCPLEKDFEIRDSKGNYELSSKLLARYLVDPNNFNNLLVTGPVNAPAYIQGSAEWCDDGPWEYDKTISRTPDKYRYGMNFGASRFYARLPRANEYWPTVPSDIESWHNANHSTYPDFSFFTWVKVDGDIESNDPVIFSINTKLGNNRLIFMIDTADKARMKGVTPDGYRLQLHVQADANDTITTSELKLKCRTSASASPGTLPGISIDADDVTTRGWYKVITDTVRDNGSTEINDNQWHHVGFTHHIDPAHGSVWNIYVNGQKMSCHLATYHALPGSQNDIWRYAFDSDAASGGPGVAATAAGYDSRIWAPWRGAGWRTPDAQTGLATNSGSSVYWMRFQKLDDVSSVPGIDFSAVGGVYSPLHGEHSLEFDEMDRVSIGQEYDSRMLRRFKTTRRGARTYRTFRYRRPSQLFDGKMADVSLWNSRLTDGDIGQLYNARFGSSEGDKWFNIDYDSSGNEVPRKHTARTMVTYGQWTIHGSVNESPIDINDVLEAGLSREVNTFATYKSEVLKPIDGTSYTPPRYEFLDFDGSPSTNLFVSGTYVMEGTVKRPIKHNDGLSYVVGTRGGTNGYMSYYKTSHNGTRTGQENDIASARALFNAVPGKDIIDRYYDFGYEHKRYDHSNLNIFELENQDSPYILMPNDKLVFGWQSAEVFYNRWATTKGTGPHMTLGSNLRYSTRDGSEVKYTGAHDNSVNKLDVPIGTPGSIEWPAEDWHEWHGFRQTRMKITLFGSYIQDGKEKQGDLNQNLTSDAIHEALQFETPVHDKFELEDIGYNAGAYTDDVVSGSMSINERYGRKTLSITRENGRRRVDYGSNIARRKIASVAEHSQGSRGSMLRGVRVIDSFERYYDTVVASPAAYHGFNGNGILEWSSPWFNGGTKQRSLCFGEPRPSDMKVVVPEKTIIRCREEGWYEDLPQGVIKLTFSRLWTADYLYGNYSLPYYEHAPDSNTSGDKTVAYAKLHSVPWYISTEVKTDFLYAAHNNGTSPGKWFYQLADITSSYDPAQTVDGTRYEYKPYAAGQNYMFTTSKETISEIDKDNHLRETYFSIYDANGDLHVVHLDWGDVASPEASNNVITVSLEGWDTGDNGWSPGIPSSLLSEYNVDLDGTGGSANDSLDLIQKQYNDDITGWSSSSASDLNAIKLNEDDLHPSGDMYMPADALANRVGAAINSSSMFEVLEVESSPGVYAFEDAEYKVGYSTYSIYVRTISGGLTAADPSGTSNSTEGGGIPGIHYHSPEIDSSTLYRNYYRYISTNSAAIVSCKYLAPDLREEGPLAYNNWGMVQEISNDRITFTDSGTPDAGTLATTTVDTSSEGDGYDIGAIAGDIGLSSSVTGVSEYIQNLRPNNPDQFRRQLPVIEEKDGFERISDYTLDGCFMQIHDAKDNAYNIWYKLDDDNGQAPAPPTTSGILVTIDTVPPGAPASTIARETMLALSGSHSDKFELFYNDGDDYFTVLNTQDGSTKDADSTIMGLPTTTGFYLTDESGAEYDNQTIRWSWTGGIGFFSFAAQAVDTESYAVGKTPEDPAGEEYWHGDPIQEGVDPYHVNTNSTIDAYWLGSYPFEPKYSSLKRGRTNKDNTSWNVTEWDDETGEFVETTTEQTGFSSIIITGSNMPSIINDPTLEAVDENGALLSTGSSYPVLTVIGDGSPQPIGSRYDISAKTSENFLKFYFGTGDNWQKNPSIEIVTIYSDGYDWPSAIPKIRGWKYGLRSALPENTNAVYSHNSYGQFRDLLEQRKDSRFYRKFSRGPWAGRSLVTSAPVRCRFVSEDGVLTTPEKTWSQNLSRFCTSSLPYFDDGRPRNREYPINEDELNTVFTTIKG